MDEEEYEFTVEDEDGVEFTFVHINVDPEELAALRNLAREIINSDEWNSDDAIDQLDSVLESLGIDNLSDRLTTNLTKDQMYAVGEEIIKNNYDRMLDDPLGFTEEELSSMILAFKTWYPVWCRSRLNEEDHYLSDEMIEKYIMVINAVRRFREEVKTISDQMMNMTPAVFAMMDKYTNGDSA